MSDTNRGQDEGADPNDDIKKQNPGQTTTGDLAGEGDDDEEEALEDDDLVDPDDDSSKTQDLARAGRTGMDPDAGQE